jgi:hypothetical protein
MVISQIPCPIFGVLMAIIMGVVGVMLLYDGVYVKEHKIVLLIIRWNKPKTLTMTVIENKSAVFRMEQT